MSPTVSFTSRSSSSIPPTSANVTSSSGGATSKSPLPSPPSIPNGMNVEELAPVLARVLCLGFGRLRRPASGSASGSGTGSGRIKKASTSSESTSGLPGEHGRYARRKMRALTGDFA